jgi:multidrug efflux pump subunit AcrA (membrane-fusion protein)
MPEADITKIHMQNPAEITLDAYGRDTVFEALVTKMDPAEIIIDGVPTYKVTLQFTAADSRIRSGMTANITIITAEKENVLAIPQRAIIREDGNKFVQIVQGTSIQKVQVETGLQASNGNIEIINGIQEGERVITFFPE